MKRGEEEFDLSDVIGGTLNIFGLKIDLAKLLSSPEELRGQMEGLRERLKQAGGKEVISDEEWQKGGVNVSGHIRTRSILGDREYHIGTSAPPRPRARREEAPPPPPEVVEPSLDLFDEPDQLTIIADVPGVGPKDMEIEVEGRQLSLTTNPEAPRAYRKKVDLPSEVDPDSLRATCRNGVLEIRLRKRRPSPEPS